MSKSKRVLPFLLILCTFLPPCYAYQARIVEVPEGDLVTVVMENRTHKIRLYGIVSPVRGQPFHEKARILTNFLSLQRNVEVTNIFRDADGVMNALVRVEGNKDNLNQQLVAHGMAWVDPSLCNSRPCDEWRELETLAQDKGIGLWAEFPAIPPWEWKLAERMEIYQKSIESTGRE